VAHAWTPPCKTNEAVIEKMHSRHHQSNHLKLAIHDVIQNDQHFFLFIYLFIIRKQSIY